MLRRGLVLVVLLAWPFAASSGSGGVAAARAPAVVPVADAAILASGVIGPDGGRIVVPSSARAIPGAEAHLAAESGRPSLMLAISAPAAERPPLFPRLPVMRVAASVPLESPVEITFPYDAAFLDEFGVGDESVLGLYQRGDDGLWASVHARVDTAGRVLRARVEAPGTWVIAPGWLLKPWQRHGLVGQLGAAGKTALVIHGWNASPWDACQLALMAGLSRAYGRVVAYAYPSALDINESARWLRDEITANYPDATFNVIGFSEGGLVARAAIEPGAWNGGQTIAASVRHLITIATPHTGLVAGLGPSVLGDIAAAQMHPGSELLRALNASPPGVATRYFAIAGDGAGDRVSDTLVSVDSALGRGVLAPEGMAVLPLLHAATYGGGPGMPCDPRVYDTIADRVADR